MKKILALALAVMMVLSLAVVASADAPAEIMGTGELTISVNHDHDGHTFEAYQIFSGSFNADGVLSDIVWGDGVSATAQAALGDAATVASNLDGDTMAVDTDAAKAFAGEFAKTGYLANPTARTSVLTDGHYVLKGLPIGYYLIKDMDGTQTGEGEAQTFYMLKVTHGNTIVNPKAGVPSLVKKVDDANDSSTDGVLNSTYVDGADHDIGDMITFTLDAQLPKSGLSYYKSYYLAFHDVMDKALKLQPSTIKVYLNDNDVTTAFPLTQNGQEFTLACSDILATGFVNLSADAVNTVRVVYQAQLTTDEVEYGNPGNENKAWLEYSNDPNHSTPPADPEDPDDRPTGTTPPDTVKVFTYILEINKIAGSDAAGKNIPLAGADFTLYKKDKVSGNYVEVPVGNTQDVVNKVYFYTNAEGDVVTMDTSAEAEELAKATGFYFKGIDDGDYKIVETTVPSGYNTAADVEFTVIADHVITVNPNNPVVTLKALKTDKESELAGDVTTGIIDGDIINTKGTVLPSTGGMGTTIFYVVGTVLMLGAAILLITKRRMNGVEM